MLSDSKMGVLKNILSKYPRTVLTIIILGFLTATLTYQIKHYNHVHATLLEEEYTTSWRGTFRIEKAVLESGRVVYITDFPDHPVNAGSEIILRKGRLTCFTGHIYHFEKYID